MVPSGKSALYNMLGTLLLLCLITQTAPSTTSGTSSDQKFNCVISKTAAESTQLWAVPQRDGIDVQALADKHLPVAYVHEIELVIRPPRNVTVKTLTVVEIAKQQALVTIDLSGTNVADDDLLVLSSLPNLEWLVLDSTNVTDIGLLHLEKLKKLRLLSLHGCNVTADATGPLHYAFPGIVVITGDGQTRVSIRNNN